MIVTMSLIISVMIAMRILIIFKKWLVSALLLIMVIRSILVSLISWIGIRVLVLLLVMISLIIRKSRHHVVWTKELRAS